MARLALDTDRGLEVPNSKSVPWTRVNAALATAEAARAAAMDGPVLWPPIAAAFLEIGLRPNAAYAMFRFGAASIGAGDRATGAVALREAAALAEDIGWTVLLGRIEALGRAARIDLAHGALPARAPTPGPALVPGNDWGLSKRELEVLALVAEGRTNGEIGARLFIPTKTASVHVTHILDKLGVSSRTEAALLATRAGLLG